MLPRLLELLGVRAFYWVMSHLAGERMLPPWNTAESKEWSREKVAEVKEGARYFLIANLGRAAIYIFPMMAAIKDRATAPFWTMVGIVFFHGLCILLEVYKNLLCKRHDKALKAGLWIEGHPAEPPDIRLSQKMDWYFAPRRLETELLYRIIGVEAFKNVVTFYVENTRLTREERDNGKKASYLKGGSKQEKIQFVRDTRVAETIHFCALLINVPVFIEGLALNIPSVVWFILPVLILDIYLVLLQRQHRLRMWPFILRTRSLDAREA
jgi:hypothetical protein